MEPERPIEKLLRDTATKRRAEQGEEFSLSAPARRALQREVERMYRNREATPAQLHEAVAWLRLRVTCAVAVVLVLVIIAAWLAPERGEHRAEKLALNSRRLEPSATPGPATATPAPMLAAPGEPSAQPDRLLSKDSAKETLKPAFGSASGSIQTQQFLAMLDQKSEVNASEDKILTDNDGQTLKDTSKSLANFPSPAAAPALAPPALALVGVAPGSPQTDWAATNTPLAVRGDYSLAGAASLAVTTAPMEQGRATELASAPARASAASANFSARQYRSINMATEGNRVLSGAPGGSSRQSAVAKAVLTSFRMEKAGQTLRIIDKDGSVYSGYVETPKPSARSRQGFAPGAAPAAAAAEPGSSRVTTHSAPNISTPDYYVFRVTGTNRSLKQHLVFTGNLMTEPAKDLTNAFAADGVAEGVQMLKAAPADLSNGVSRTRITGQVKIGNGEAIEINAVRTNP